MKPNEFIAWFAGFKLGIQQVTPGTVGSNHKATYTLTQAQMTALEEAVRSLKEDSSIPPGGFGDGGQGLPPMRGYWLSTQPFSYTGEFPFSEGEDARDQALKDLSSWAINRAKNSGGFFG